MGQYLFPAVSDGSQCGVRKQYRRDRSRRRNGRVYQSDRVFAVAYCRAHSGAGKSRYNCGRAPSGSTEHWGKRRGWCRSTWNRRCILRYYLARRSRCSDRILGGNRNRGCFISYWHYNDCRPIDQPLECIYFPSLRVGDMRFLTSFTGNCWDILALVLRTCVFVFAGLWVLLLGTICSSPSLPDAATGHMVSYNCHGSIVFINAIQHGLLVGLFPAILIAGLCGMAAKKRANRQKKDDKSCSG